MITVWLWMTGLKHVPASSAGVFTVLLPVSAAAVGVFFLGEGLGVDWPANRYLLIALWGDADVRGRKLMQTTVVNDWRCRYNLQTGKFDVPALFSADNAKAVVPKSPGES